MDLHSQTQYRQAAVDSSFAALARTCEVLRPTFLSSKDARLFRERSSANDFSKLREHLYT